MPTMETERPENKRRCRMALLSQQQEPQQEPLQMYDGDVLDRLKQKTKRELYADIEASLHRNISAAVDTMFDSFITLASTAKCQKCQELTHEHEEPLNLVIRSTNSDSLIKRDSSAITSPEYVSDDPSSISTLALTHQSSTSSFSAQEDANSDAADSSASVNLNSSPNCAARASKCIADGSEQLTEATNRDDIEKLNNECRSPSARGDHHLSQPDAQVASQSFNSIHATTTAAAASIANKEQKTGNERSNSFRRKFLKCHRNRSPLTSLHSSPQSPGYVDLTNEDASPGNNNSNGANEMSCTNRTVTEAEATDFQCTTAKCDATEHCQQQQSSLDTHGEQQKPRAPSPTNRRHSSPLADGRQATTSKQSIGHSLEPHSNNNSPTAAMHVSHGERQTMADLNEQTDQRHQKQTLLPTTIEAIVPEQSHQMSHKRVLTEMTDSVDEFVNDVDERPNPKMPRVFECLNVEMEEGEIVTDDEAKLIRDPRMARSRPSLASFARARDNRPSDGNLSSTNSFNNTFAFENDETDQQQQPEQAPSTPTTTDSRRSSITHSPNAQRQPSNGEILRTNKLKYAILSIKCHFEGCENSYDDNVATRKHMFTDHNVLPNRCLMAKCNGSFRTPDQLTAHLKQAHNIVPEITELKCPLCQMTVKHYNDLCHHLCLYHFEGNFVCALANCCHVEKTRIAIIEHYNSEHVSPFDTDRFYLQANTFANLYRVSFVKCWAAGCGHIASPQKLAYHLSTAHKCLPFPCLLPACKSFNSEKELFHHFHDERHPSPPEPGQLLKCPHCATEMSHALLLHQHIVHCHQRGLFECEENQCGFRSSRRIECVEHYYHHHISRHLEHEQT